MKAHSRRQGDTHTIKNPEDISLLQWKIHSTDVVLGAVSVTGHTAYREPFEPMLPGVSFAEFNNLDSVKALVSDQTCAIILEPLQGEGGINLATQEFMEGIRKICDENDILMICDEVQCGMGRTGAMFAWQKFGVKPDIMTMAKGIGNGIPVGLLP